ncbi:midasin [Kwoniella heveanensis BCC8398]|uniref:Midasin n=1 Tax=Kwoniella heveanensis BCC8398 TaxID=1296120 RepID=A0A1B9GNE6_9TREE|nr:midasin [Kwoniella heveanensis BCC8398]
MSEGQDAIMAPAASSSGTAELPDSSTASSSSPSPSPSPLYLDLRQQVTLFLADLGYTPTSSPPPSLPQTLLAYVTNTSASSSQLLSVLSTLAAYDGLSEIVTLRFQPVLIDILSRWLEDSQFSDLSLLEKRLEVLSTLPEIYPELWNLIYAFILKSPFRSSPLATITQAELTTTSPDRLHPLLLSYLRIIAADPAIAARNSWPITPLHQLRTEHPDLGVRLLAIQILSKQRRWSEEKRMSMEKEWVGEVDKVDAGVKYGWELSTLPTGGFETKRVIADGWMLPIVEDKRVKRGMSYVLPECLASPNITIARQTPSNFSYRSEPTISASDISSHITLVADQLLLRASPLLAPTTLLHVRTTPTDEALCALCPLIQRGIPILLTSPPSSGKTHLLQYLSSTIYPSHQPTNRVLTIPLADTSIDVKSLIGTYVSSPMKPGTFEWMEGALAKAIRAGRWVIFEDVDKGSTEMLVTLAGIARSLRPGRPGRRARLTIPGREDIEAGEGFGLFVTRTIRQDYAAPTFFGHHIFTEVNLAAPSDEDILAILTARFQRLPRSLLSTLVEIWHHLRPLDKLSGQVKARDIGLRDLEKWCARVERSLPSNASLAALEQSSAGILSNTVLQDEVFLEAVDIFVACLDTKGVSLSKRDQMLAIISKGLGMDEDRVTAVTGRKPNLDVSPGSRQLHMGRIVMDIAASSSRREPASSSRPFALTRPSLILLERIAAALALGEPALLVGETGTGKTTAVQHIASIVKKPLTVLNLSMQTESSDLLGGFKPIDASISARNLHARWQKLFCETFSMGKSQNGAYVEAAAKALSSRKWGRCADLWTSSARRAIDKLGKGESESTAPPQDPPTKRRKITKATKMAIQWQSLLVDITDFDLHHVKMNSKLVFSFVEGPLVKAMRSGEWILLDEVNLASQETLEAISTILEGPTASLVLTERGDVEPIPRHPQFRLFACMNPATDVGKKDLPPNLRARFTELYVPPPDDDRDALISIVSQYLGDATAGDKSVILDVVELYTTLKQLSAAKEIVDGSNAAPHYSMRTLARALTFAVESAPLFGLRRGLWEGFLMAFTMSLDVNSARIAHEAGQKFILAPMKNARAVLAQIPSLPASLDPDDFVRFGPFWLQRGPLPPAGESRYIITPSVQAKLSDLARVILTKRYPVLIQGPTSAGKTSAVEFLARQTGHRFVRINNHEHTDIQEYLGTYVTDPRTGNLIFQEGLLVTAVRQGHWIVLDELNLAPTDVLEALNRLLDDNRELVIPETQEVIRPHPNFILFATQNPPGLYAGRKVLSRAFRNRFLEVHFDDVPKDELETILCQRCQIAPSYAKKIVQVFEELRHRRQASRVFESKGSFATLRDLFRWAERGAVGYQQLAEDGYMLLAERARQEEDKVVIKQVIEEVMKVTVDEPNMYGLFDKNSTILSRMPTTTLPVTKMVWTKAMQRLFALVAAALTHNEPVLLVGETGCGKTSVCEVIATMFGQKLVGVNCHQNMETADLLGSQRPVRNRLERRSRIISAISLIAPVSPSISDDELVIVVNEAAKRVDVDQEIVKQCQRDLKQLSALFEWSDGPLVHAMSAGDLLLLDEVSLADDSVLERLNSVLEPGRTLVLAEKGGVDIDEATIIADDRFHVVATMNPGGDFGKKELSPALRNRFTEIWVPALNDRGDLLQIIGQSWKREELRECGPSILDFFLWFGERLGDAAGLGLRDILAWVSFTDDMFSKGLNEAQAFHHGGQMVLVDGLESLPQVAGLSTASVATLRSDCLRQLDYYASSMPGGTSLDAKTDLSVKLLSEAVAIGDFAVPRGPIIVEDTAFRFNAPTTASNTMRLLRGCQLPKAILLEGSPGVGKTSLVSALAAVSGHRLQRINLSDQTDLIDLFGSDLPVEGGAPGEFQWRDAAFLDAMQKGDWVLLDEMNLASQTVLEGLNAVLDHRGTVYIPELGKSFDRHPDFRVFAAQNPLQQGGGRKGLPKSFLNRFTKVYLQEHTPEDLMIICRDLHPLPSGTIEQMIAFNEVMREQTMITRTIGREGSPWEFNLRDLFRWFTLLASPNGLEKTSHPVEYFRMVYRQRFRSSRDWEAVTAIFERIFSLAIDTTRPNPYITPSYMQVGHSVIKRRGNATIDVQLRHHHLDIAESVLKAIEMGWLTILAGENGAGKRALVRGLAQGAGRPLGEFAMHPGVDTSEILGSFEQQDIGRLLDNATRELVTLINEISDTHPTIAGRSIDILAARERCADVTDLDAVPAYYGLCDDTITQLATHTDPSLARQALDDLIKVGPNAIGFAWVDGQLIHAIKNGGWFLISDANLCSASVLDRLNSLCESDGVLVLSEKGSSTGSPEVLKPHKDFRLFMTYDPRHGELSRAMRNRGVELFLPSLTAETSQIIQCSFLADQSLLRTASALEIGPAINVDTQKPILASSVANSVSSQCQKAVPYLARIGSASGPTFASLYQIASAVLSSGDLPELLRVQASQAALNKRTLPDVALLAPIDISLNPNLVGNEQTIVFAILQGLLRNEVRREEVKSWLSDSNNIKSVLSVSALSTRRGPSRSKPSAGSDVYPFTTYFREAISQQLPRVAVEYSQSTGLMERLDRICVYVYLIEEHAKTSTFDYSSTKLLATWLDEELQHLPALTPVLEKLQGLVKNVQLTSGLGQSQVWALLREARGDGTTRAEMTRFALSLLTFDPELRQSILNALSAMSEGMPSSEAVTELEALITGSPVASRQDTDVAEQWVNWPVLSTLGLAALNRQVPTNALSVMLEDSQTDLTSMLLVQRARSASAAPTVVFQALVAWLQGMWDHAKQNGEDIDGPADLFKPVRLSSALRFSTTEPAKLSEIPQQDDALKFSVKTVLLSANEQEHRRKDALVLALNAIGMSTNNASQALAQISTVLSNESTDPAQTHLREVLQRRITPALQAISEQAEDLRNLAALWTSASRFLLDLYVTNIPIDPGVRRTLLGEVVSTRLSLLQEELAAVQAGEIALKGISDSSRATEIRHRVASLEQEGAGLGPALDRASDATRLSYLFSEVHAFMDDPYSESRTNELIIALLAGHTQALARERDFQLASSAFIQRLSTNYHDILDLVQPVITAVLFGKFGMRVLARDAELRGAKAISTVSAAVGFPLAASVRRIHRMSTGAVADKTTAITAQLLATAAHSHLLGTQQQRVSHLPGLFLQLDHLYQSWSAVRLREQQEAQASESLYRVRKTDIEVLSDQEQEEKEFAELFPQYEDAGAEDSAIKVASADKEEEVKQGFSRSHVAAFHALVKDVFSGRTTTSHDLLKGMIDETLHSAFDPTAYDECLDSTSLAHQVTLLHRRQLELKTSPIRPNFYLSPNEPEVRKAHSILIRLVARLNLLIEEWPEQMVPQHIRDRCERMLMLDIRSPVALILSAMEQLLVHTEDWEGYANRENSLSAFRDEITHLIIEWRKLELASWMRLLDDQAAQYIAQDDEWTLRLYGALIHGAVSAADIAKHVEEVLPMISTYINSSTFGSFSARLDLLTCFERMATDLSAQVPELATVATLLHNMLANARLFEPRLADSMHNQRSVIDKAIKDFVKLASWKDVNVYALKASAVKSHRQLHRSIRKFRDLLRQPVAPVLGELTGIVPQEPAVAAEQTPSAIIEVTPLTRESIKARSTDSQAIPEVLSRLNETFDRYASVHSGLRPSLTGPSAPYLESMAVDIIETTASLAKATPSTLTKENKKIVNNLASRKRKAFADLLKTLRACGFSQAVRADQLSRQQSTIWLANRPALLTEGLPDGFNLTGVKKIETYHHRMDVLMSALRAAFNGHNDDIASQDLQRGIGFTESVYATALTERDRVVAQLRSLAKVTSIVDRLAHCAKSSAVAGGRPILDALIEAEANASQIHSALREVEEGIRQLRDLQGVHPPSEETAVIHELRQETTLFVEAVSLVLKSVRSSGCLLFTYHETRLLGSFDRIRSKLVKAFGTHSTTSPDLRHLLLPVVDMVKPMRVFGDIPTTENISSEVWRKSDELIQALLVVAQQMKAPTLPELQEDEQPHIPTEMKEQRAFSSSLHIHSILDRINIFAEDLASQNRLSTAGAACLSRIIPFVKTYAETFTQSLNAHIHTVKSSYKLSYVVGRVMLDLAQKGFCKPSEQSDDAGDGEGDDMVEGSGMGAGTGDKNVSSEIKEESQVEGLQGEEEEEEQEKQGGEDDDDDAFSMDEDFEGKMDEGKEKADGESGDESEEEDHDEHVGDVDPLDPGAVDEKFWGDEKEEEQEGGGEELMDQKTQEEQGESEMTAKEKENKDTKDKKDEKEQTQEEGREGEEQSPEGRQEDETGGQEGEEIEEEPAGEEGEQEEDEDAPGVQDQQEVAVPEGDKLDLPEDLNFDDDGEDDAEQGDDLDDSMSMDDDGNDEDRSEEQEGSDIDMGNEDEGDMVEEAPPATGVGEDDTQEEGQTEQNVDLSASNEQNQESELGKGVSGGAEGESKEEKDADKQEGEKEELYAEAKGQDGPAPHSQQQSGSSNDQQEADGPVDSAGAPMPADDQSQPQASRSLGDIMKEIGRRRDEILSQQERENEQPSDDQQAPLEAPGQVEYINDDQAKDDDTQALGRAGDEERQKLENLNIVDEEEDAQADRPGMEEDEDEDDAAGEDSPHNAKESIHRSATSANEDREREEKALTQADIGSGPQGPSADVTMDVDLENLEDGIEGTDIKPDIETEEPELNLVDLADANRSDIAPEDIWRRYASLTSDLSYALCEQLRLILEPTLATRLQGDFRTGKRLNMRKIIPYIASEYTKDKIWLRRTKPSRREYQVLLSLDDSRSMSESHSVDLAYQTLALVAQAMNKLEVGQVSIAKFGESVDILHPFKEGGFTDTDGAKVMSSFGFDQHKTDVASLVERTLGYLSDARSSTAMSSSAPDLWQLQIIISDGVCQDHSKLRRLLRRAIEERVMIVFIIVDSLHQTTSTPAPGANGAGTAAGRPSILSMQTVEYKNVGGQMQLEMQRYLDTFPFEFYVVLRDVEALPGVLADTLRQWMARVSQSQE